ncbi:MAG: hypothetical protein ABH852_05890 [Methanobacteriota archaeon]
MNSVDDGRKVLKVEKYSNLTGGLVVTSVKLSERGKKMLDALQAEMTLKSGGKVSQQELLELILDDVERRTEELVSKIFESGNKPLSEKEIKRIMSLPKDCGVVTSEEDIDKYLYGKE